MNRILDVWVNKSWLDWLLIAAISVDFAWRGAIVILPRNNADSLLQTMSSIAVGMIGLGSVAATLIITTTPSSRMKQVMQEAGRELMDQIFGCIFAFLLCIFLFVLPYFKAYWMPYALANWLFILSSVLLLLRSVRLVILLRLFLRLLV